MGRPITPIKGSLLDEMSNRNIIVEKNKYLGMSLEIPCECLVCGYRWNPRASYVFKTKRCPKCSKAKAHEKLKKPFSYYETKAREIFGNRYLYNEASFIDSKTPMEMVCKVHGMFRMSMCSHTRKTRPAGCNLCGNESIAKSRSISHAQYIDKAKKKFPQFNYSKTTYISSSEKVTIICKKHGEQEVNAGEFLTKSKYGCPDCAQEHGNHTQVEKAKIIFFKKVSRMFPEYDFRKFEYTHSKVSGLVKCAKHDYWEARPVDLLQGRGCPICSGSKGEERIAKYLYGQKVHHLPQKTFEGCIYKTLLRFDFYLPEQNMCVEFQGHQHYQIVQFGGCSLEHAKREFNLGQKRDQIKRDFCKENNIKLLEIPYWEFENIEQILNKSIRRE